MALNLVELIQKQISGPVLDQLGGIIGEDTHKTQTAIQGAIPSILGGMMDASTSTEGSTTLMTALKSFDQEDNMLGNLGSMLSGGGHQSLQESGSNMLNGLFGDKIDAITGAISQFSGIGQNSASSLMGMVAPIAMSVLGK